MPITRPGRQRAFRSDIEPEILAPAANERRHGQRGEEAEHDGRNAGENFQNRLGPGAHAARGVFGQVDGREQAERAGHADGDET